jgi:uncharacterized membrane protein YhiD involved in acid resistance
VAAIGVSVGFGFWLMALMTTVIVLLTHVSEFLLERTRPTDEVATDPQDGRGPGR